MTTPDQDPPPKIVSARPTPIAALSIASVATALGLGGLQLLSPATASKVPDVFGTVSSWISAGGIMGILSLLIWLQLGNRKIRVDERAADNVDSADIRDHYAEEVRALRERIDQQAARHAVQLEDVEKRYQRNVAEVERRYGAALDAAETRHRECEAQREELADLVRKLKDDYAGIERKLLTQSSDRVIQLSESGATPSPAVSRAAHRVRRILNPGGADSNEEP